MKTKILMVVLPVIATLGVASTGFGLFVLNDKNITTVDNVVDMGNQSILATNSINVKLNEKYGGISLPAYGTQSETQKAFGFDIDIKLSSFINDLTSGDMGWFEFSDHQDSDYFERLPTIKGKNSRGENKEYLILPYDISMTMDIYIPFKCMVDVSINGINYETDKRDNKPWSQFGYVQSDGTLGSTPDWHSAKQGANPELGEWAYDADAEANTQSHMDVKFCFNYGIDNDCQGDDPVSHSDKADSFGHGDPKKQKHTILTNSAFDGALSYSRMEDVRTNYNEKVFIKQDTTQNDPSHPNSTSIKGFYGCVYCTKLSTMPTDEDAAKDWYETESLKLHDDNWNIRTQVLDISLEYLAYDLETEGWESTVQSFSAIKPRLRLSDTHSYSLYNYQNKVHTGTLASELLA